MTNEAQLEMLKLLITFFASLIASSGFWLYLTKRIDKRDMKTLLLLGLAHDRIIYLGMHYIERGFITQDEYESLHQYLYTPYIEMGGNGSAKRVMCEVDKLPIKSVQINSKGDPCYET